MTESKCKEAHGHEGHLCVLASEEKIAEIRELVKAPKFICFNCGRVADAAENLCSPMSLEK